MKRLFFSLCMVPFIAVIILIGTALSYPDFCFNVEPGCGIGCHYDDYLNKCFESDANSDKKASQVYIDNNFQDTVEFENK